MTANVEIIVGTYEEFLLGYKLEEKNEKQILRQSFADKSHAGSLKCVSVQGQWIASGGSDDRIFIYDMRTRKQSQIILSHTGSINALAFTPDCTHILSGSDDGRMLATRVSTWTSDATWQKAHGGSTVTHISCHPSGKLALSLGADLVLRTWNLVKGRVAYKTNLKSRNTLGTAPECLAWSLGEGSHFTLSGQRVVEIWSIKTADVVRSYKTTAKPICVAWISNSVCLVGLENGKLLWLSPDDAADAEPKTVEAHTARIKAICYHANTLVTASSTGELKTWQVNETARKLKEIAVTNIGCRPTCLGLLNLEQFGSNYVLNRSIISEQKPQKNSKKLAKAKKPLPRGVVTIEYENNDDDNQDESVKEEETSQIENQEESDDNNDDDEDGDSDDNNEDDDAGDSDAVGNADVDDESGDEAASDLESDTDDEQQEAIEPILRLPKSKKHKEALLQQQQQQKQKRQHEAQTKKVPAKKQKLQSSTTNSKKAAKKIK